MLHIILLILKIIGIVILALLGILLGVVLLVLFVPIRYEIRGEKMEKLTIQGKVSWLLRFLFIKVQFIENELQYKVKIFGFTILDSLKPKKKKKVKKNKTKKITKKKEKKKALPKKNKKSKAANQNNIPSKTQNKVQDNVRIEKQSKIEENTQTISKKIVEDNIQATTQNKVEENIKLDTTTTIEDNIKTTTQNKIEEKIQTTVQNKVDEDIQTTQKIVEDNIQTTTQTTTETNIEDNTKNNLKNNQPTDKTMSISKSSTKLNETIINIEEKIQIDTDQQEDFHSTDEDFEESTEVEEGLDHNTKGLWNKIKNFFHKMKNLYYKIKASLFNWKEKLSRIGEIKNIILEFIRDDEVRAGIKTIFASLLKILKHIKPKILKADVEFGTGDPCSTGQALGVLGILYSYYGEHVQITPNFVETVYEGKLYAKGRIRLFTLLIICIKLIREKEFKYLVERMKKIKEEL